MTIQYIPISAVAAQTFTIQLGNQSCDISIYQKNTGLFFDMVVNDTPCVNSVLCLNLVGLVREAYYGFVGQLAFFDTQGTSDPEYTGLGSRYQLVYES
jgi:hypothetical protein